MEMLEKLEVLAEDREQPRLPPFWRPENEQQN